MQANKILRRSIFASFVFHASALLIFQHQSLWFGAKERGPIGLFSIEKKNKTEILKEVFAKFDHPVPDPKTLHHPILEPTTASIEKKIEPILAESPEIRPAAQEIPPPKARELAPPIEKIAFLMPSLKTIDLISHLPKNLILPTPTLQQVEALKPAPIAAKVDTVLTPPKIVVSASSFPLPAPKEPLATLLSLEGKKERKTWLTPTLPPAELPSLKELNTASYSSSFDTEIVYVQREEGDYLFAITLIPKEDLELPKIKQHYSFLIDRSNSIEEERLHAAKGAVYRALSELEPEDTFNIIVFDSKMEKLSPSPLAVTSKTLAQTKDFLDKVQLGSFFSSVDFFKPLFLTVPSLVKEDEIYTAILVTDGDTLTKKQAQRSLISDWTSYNQGRVALFGLGMGGDFHLKTLEAVTSFNRGKLFYSPTRRGIKRKLLKLMKTIQTPVAKNLSCKALSRTPTTLFSKISQSPHLYLHQPYVILGLSPSLDDFILFVQGRLKNQWLNVKKKISFLNAKKGDTSLHAEWALQAAYRHYENFFLDDNPEHLAKARALLEPFDLDHEFR